MNAAVSSGVRAMRRRPRRPALTIVLNSLRVGGSQSAALALARGAVDRGWDVTVASRGGALTPEFTRLGVRTIRLVMREGTADGRRHDSSRILNGLRTAASCVAVIQLWWHIVRVRGVIHVSQPWPSAVCSVVGLCCHVPVIWHVHGTSDVEMPPAFPSLVGRAVVLIIAISPEVERAVLGSAVGQQVPVQCVRTPVTVDQRYAHARSQSSSVVVLGVCSTLTKNKRAYVEAALDAAGRLCSNFPRVRILVVGEGPEAAYLKDHGDNLMRLHETLEVVFLGSVVPPHAAFAEVDVVIGMGLVAVESMLLGFRVVCASQDSLGGALNRSNFAALRETNFTGRGHAILSSETLARQCLVALSESDTAAVRELALFDYGRRSMDEFDRLWRVAIEPGS